MDMFFKNNSQNPDSFTDPGKAYTVSDIIDIIQEHSFTSLVNGLVEKRRASNSVGVICLHFDKDTKPFINMGLMNFSTLKNEQYLFTVEKFLQMYEEARIRRITKYPEQAEKLNFLSEKLNSFFREFKYDGVSPTYTFDRSNHS